MKKKPASLEILMSGGVEDAPATAPDSSTLRTSVPKPVEKLTVYVPRGAAKRLKQMALDNDCRVNDYLRDAVDLFLAKHGQPSLAEFER